MGRPTPEERDAAHARLRAAMTAQGLYPLEGLAEALQPDGAQWTAADAQGRPWVIRWLAAAGTVEARPFRHAAEPVRGRAAGLEAARAEALRIAAELRKKG